MESKIVDIKLDVVKATDSEWEKHIRTVLLSGTNYNDKYVAFWGGCFSNFFPCQFWLEGKLWTTSEKYFMWKKAVTFGDNETAEKIIKLDSPREIKKLGRQVKNFSSEVWDKVKVDIMYAGVNAKFTQDAECNNCIKEFQNQKFVEGSPDDTIWGVGIHYQDENVFDESKWRGQNLLGNILTRVRDEIFDDAMKAQNEAQNGIY